MTGKLKELFEKQILFQQQITKLNIIPVDSSPWCSYHLLALVEEIGEILKADKRWKTHRNTKYDPDEKLEELADMFITMLNICIFSDINVSELLNAVEEKIDRNIKRLKSVKGE